MDNSSNQPICHIVICENNDAVVSDFKDRFKLDVINFNTSKLGGMNDLLILKYDTKYSFLNTMWEKVMNAGKHLIESDAERMPTLSTDIDNKIINVSINGDDLAVGHLYLLRGIMYDITSKHINSTLLITCPSDKLSQIEEFQSYASCFKHRINLCSNNSISTETL